MNKYIYKENKIFELVKDASVIIEDNKPYKLVNNLIVYEDEIYSEVKKPSEKIKFELLPDTSEDYLMSCPSCNRNSFLNPKKDREQLCLICDYVKPLQKYETTKFYKKKHNDFSVRKTYLIKKVREVLTNVSEIIPSFINYISTTSYRDNISVRELIIAVLDKKPDMKLVELYNIFKTIPIEYIYIAPPDSYEPPERYCCSLEL